jgi:hypothetical protein
MDTLPRWAEPETGVIEREEELWLLGQPPLSRYLNYVEGTVIDGASTPRSLLVEEWRRANDYYYDLEVSEAGAADQIEISDLPLSLQSIAADVMADADFHRAFDILPTRIAMVELKRLVVAQPHINLTHTNRLRACLPANPTPTEVFQFCRPVSHPVPPISIKRFGETRYLFTSESSDFRFREAVLLRPDQIQGVEKFGPCGLMLGLVLGFSSNFLTAIQSDNRLLLHNGHHRAFALLDHGVTHAPCIIQTVTRVDELNLITSRTVQKAPAFYFKAARPPLLKDFLDPKIRKVLHIPRLLQMIDVSFDVQDHAVSS